MRELLRIWPGLRGLFESGQKVSDEFDGILRQSLLQHETVFSDILNLRKEILRAGELIAATIAGGGKILVCGNGGSAADAQHFAAELVGRFQKERKAWPAIALTTDTSILTAVANDYGFDRIFARQVEAFARPSDLLLAISTSGRSENVLKAVECARSLGACTIGLLGADGGHISKMVDLPVVVPSGITARVQEAHIFILHAWSEMIEAVTRQDQCL